MGISCDKRRKNDLICHKHREHLHKQLVLCKWSQLSFTCPISSITPRLIATTPADCKGCSGYFLILCLRYLVFWWFRAFPQAVFGTQVNPKNLFSVTPSHREFRGQAWLQNNLPAACWDSKSCSRTLQQGRCLLTQKLGQVWVIVSLFSPCGMKWLMLSK